ATGVSCTMSVCNYSTCQANFEDCNSLRTDGCEINLATDTNHCGACGTNCTTTVLNAVGIGCSNKQCTFTSCSAASFGDCNGKTSDGCETNLNAVGSCGSSCANAVNCATSVQNAGGV